MVVSTHFGAFIMGALEQIKGIKHGKTNYQMCGVGRHGCSIYDVPFCLPPPHRLTLPQPQLEILSAFSRNLEMHSAIGMEK